MARETWSRKTEFLLSCVGYAVGLGNVWRFPYLCYANGGGAFLIPYFIMLILAVLPVMVLDASLGQFTSLGCVTCWKFAPLFKGVGIAMVTISAYCSLYYPIIISYTIRYMVASFQNPLPWVGCNHTWNTINCYERPSNLNVNNGGLQAPNLTFTNMSVGTTEITETTLIYETIVWSENGTMAVTQSPDVGVRARASEEFWMHGVLGISDGIHEVGKLNWELLLCLVFAWIIIYICIMKGIKSTGKAVYFTATFPYVVLFILLIRGLTLPGSADGILLYIKPDFEKLRTSKVWKSAANQVFYSYGAGWGGILTLSSYNKFNNNCVRDAIMICTCCAFSSVFAGFVIFSVIGFMAYDSQLPVEEVVAGGPGLAFVAYPEALARLPIPQLWSFLFFFMLLTVGLDTQFVMLETALTALKDELAMNYPEMRKHQWKITIGSCLVLFCLGMPLACEGGIYIMTLLDWYSAGFSPMLMVIIEVLAVSYVYGAKRFMRDTSFMIGYTPSIYWRLCWSFSVPVVILLVLVFSFVDYTAASLGDYVFPPGAEAIGWTITMTSVLFVMIYAVVHLCRQEGSLLTRLKTSVYPASDWGPALNEDRALAGYDKLPNLDEKDNEYGLPSKTQITDKKTYIALATKDGIMANKGDPV